MATVSAPLSHYRGRFAPSPSGPLHFGSLVAALASYCEARNAGGEWLVRIEDVDLPRSHPGAEASILATLERYGLRWDGEVVRQSARTALYDAALRELERRGYVYPCACTRRELEDAPLGPFGERVYPGRCRHGIAAAHAERSQRSWRLRVDAIDPATICFRDAVQGEQCQDLARDVGDFVVRRADGLTAYQLAVVVDDAEQQVTHVVRGADLLASTARQILLQRLLGLPQPAYAHVPVAINASGEKLSKQTRAPALPMDDPLAALLAAWRLLDQKPLAHRPTRVHEFWRAAIEAWSLRRVPPVAMLPAPAALGEPAAGDGIIAA